MPLKKVRRHGSPFWYVRGTVRGQPVDETTGTEDEAAAEAYRIKRENELLDRSLLGERAPKSFVRAAHDYIQAAGLSPRDESYVIRLAELYAGKTLGQIDQGEIERAVRRFCPDNAPASINRTIIGPIAAILHHAGDKRTISRRKAAKGRTRWLTYDEAETLIAACQPKFYARYASLAPLVEFLFFTGCRLGEALALEWADVDLSRQHVVFRDTKNGDDRGIPLHPRALTALANLPHREGVVFLRPDGRAYSDRDGGGGHIKTAFRAACRRAGIKKFTPHGCRHTWATWFYAENRDIRALMELGGWKTLSQVQRYTHVNKDHLRASVNRLGGDRTGTAPETEAENKAISA
jgi:integrase